MNILTVSDTFGLKPGDAVRMKGQDWIVAEVRSNTIFTVMDLIVWRAGQRLERIIIWSGIIYVAYMIYAYLWWTW